MRRHRYPEVGRIDHFGSREIGRGHTDEPVVQAIQLDRRAGDLRVASESASPATITDNGNGVAEPVPIIFPVQDTAT